MASFRTLLPRYLPENLGNRNGMGVADPLYDCFCTNETWAWLTKGGRRMLWTIFVILLVLWLLGVVSSYTVGGFIHILLVLALVVLLINIIGGRRTVV